MLKLIVSHLQSYMNTPNSTATEI